MSPSQGPEVRYLKTVSVFKTIAIGSGVKTAPACLSSKDSNPPIVSIVLNQSQ